MIDSTKRKRRHTANPHPKNLQLNIRMSPERRTELNELCRLGGRPLSYQIEQMVAIAKLTIEFCDGNDNLQYVKEQLATAKKLWSRSIPFKPSF